jgi:type II secretion system protein N
MKIPKPQPKTILISIALFFFFLVMLFPFQNLKGYIFSNIYKQTGIVVLAEDLYLTFFGWPGVGMKNVDITIPMGGSDLDISAKKLTVRVGLSGLFPPRPSYSLYLSELKKGGSLYAKFSQSSSVTKAYFDFDKVNLDQLKLGNGHQNLVGTINGEGELYLDHADSTKSSGYIDLKGEKLKSPALNTPGLSLPAINLGPLVLKAQIKNGTAEMQSFTIGNKESDMVANFTGDLRFEKELMNSRLNLNAKFTFSEKFKADAESQTLLTFFGILDPNKTGNYDLRLNPSLQEAASGPYWIAFVGKLLTQAPSGF